MHNKILILIFIFATCSSINSSDDVIATHTTHTQQPSIFDRVKNWAATKWHEFKHNEDFAAEQKRLIANYQDQDRSEQDINDTLQKLKANQQQRIQAGKKDDYNKNPLLHTDAKSLILGHDKLHKQHEQELEELRAKMESLKDEQAAHLRKIQAEHEQRIAQLQHDHEQTTSKHTVQLTTQGKKAREAMQQLQREHEHTIKQLQADHHQHIEHLKEEHRKREAQLQDEASAAIWDKLTALHQLEQETEKKPEPKQKGFFQSLLKGK